MENWYLDLLTRFEGFRDKPYMDNGSYSIGYGSKLMLDGTPITEKSTITESQARQLARNRISSLKKDLVSVFPNYNSYPEQLQYALVDHAYRGGKGNFTQKSPKFTKAVQDAMSDNILTQDEAKAIIKELEIDSAVGGEKDRKLRRAAMILGVYDPAHNGTVYSQNSPYKTFNVDFYTPGTYFGNLLKKKYKWQMGGKINYLKFFK